MNTVTTNCPNCDVEITMEVESDAMIQFLPFVHCTPCCDIIDGQCVTEKRIKHICDLIRISSGDPEKIRKLEGALKAQYSSAKMLREKLEARSGTTRPKENVAPDANQRLPW